MLTKNTSSPKFDCKKPVSNGILLPKFINRKEDSLKPCFMVHKCVPSMVVSDGDFKYCEFTVSEDGCYNVNSQTCVKLHKERTVTDFMQHGICEIGHIDSGLMQTHYFNDKIEVDYAIIKNISGIMEMKKDVKYVCWCLLSSEDNSNFSFESELSTCKTLGFN